MLRTRVDLRHRLIPWVFGAVLPWMGCAPEEPREGADTEEEGSGGEAAASGGASSSGGSTATGGNGTGGMDSSAGGDASGGSVATGGDGSGGAPEPDAVAVATIESINESSLTGTATFTQIGDTVTLVIDLEGCPTEVENNPHGTHLHQVNDCTSEGEAAGGHWASGELIGNITCDSATTQHTVSQSTAAWTIGGDPSKDITQHAIMVHNSYTGTKIGCGEIVIQE